MVEGRRILFVTYGGGHVEIVSHLLTALAERNMPKPAVLALTAALARLKGGYCEMRRCADYLPIEGYEEAWEKGANLAHTVWTEGSVVTWEETCAYLGISICDLERSEGKKAAQALYAQYGRKAFCPVHFMQEVLKREQPDILVTTCHVRMERAAIIAARNLGVRSVLIEDLLGYSLLGEYPYGQPGNLIDRAEWPDRVVSLNGAVKQIIEENGYPGNRVLPLGQPVFSNWRAEYDFVEPPALFEGTGTKPVVTWMCAGSSEYYIPQSVIWLDIARRRRDLNFVIKLHPSNSTSDFIQAYGPFPENLRVLSEEPALNIVKASDLVVIFRSTVGMLCMMMAKPMIVWDTTGMPEVLPYVASGAAEPARRDDELEPLIDKILQERGESRVSPPHPLFNVPDRAADRIVDWLVSGAPQLGEEV
tara:strand:- start:21710 stop:22969 length:1260 start_codon:yes stop_codon:yes gene_type:complete